MADGRKTYAVMKYRFLPIMNQDVNENCDGVDLNRNYQFEWENSNPPDCNNGVNNSEYSGPIDSTDNDGDEQLTKTTLMV